MPQRIVLMREFLSFRTTLSASQRFLILFDECPMKIAVTCPGCLQRFEVSEKFAGKKGPCPKCKKEITVPALSEQVVIHAPETEGPKDAKGSPVLKPIRRVDVKFSWPIAALVAGVGLVLVLTAIGIRFSVPEPPTVLLALTAIALGPLLAFGGYFFLHESELEGYTGKEAWVRSAICGGVYALTWGIYWLIPQYLLENATMAENSLLTASLLLLVMMVIGTITAILAFELENFAGVMHYMLYLSITLTLTIIAGTAIAQPLAKEGAAANASGSKKRTVQVAPSKAAATAPASAKPATGAAPK